MNERKVLGYKGPGSRHKGSYGALVPLFGEPRLGSRLSLQLGPREWTDGSRCTGLLGCPEQGAVWLAAGRGTCGPLEHRCSVTCWELVPTEMGRFWEDWQGEVGLAHLLCLEHSALLVPSSLPSFL